MPATTQPISGNGRFVPPTHHLSARIPREFEPRRVPAARQWGIAQLATTLLVLLTLGFGYRAVDPFGSGPDHPRSIPGAVVPATSATSEPTVASLERQGHVIIGAWQWTNSLDEGSRGVFASNGTYVEDADYGSNGNGFVAIGFWRATGKRTVELMLKNGREIPLDDVFTPGYEVPGNSLIASDPGFVRVLLEVDANGNVVTGSGWLETPDGNGGITKSNAFTLTGYRMRVVSDLFGTPTP